MPTKHTKVNELLSHPFNSHRRVFKGSIKSSKPFTLYSKPNSLVFSQLKMLN